jgi:transcriptional regulator with XRE-family HTH domain
MAIRDLFLGGKKFNHEPPLVASAPPADDRRRSHFSDRLRDYIERSGHTQESFADVLSDALNTPVSRSRLTSWLNSNATPRLDEQEIFEACDEILERSDGTPQLESGNVAAIAINKYLKMGLTRKALSIAGQVPQSTLSQWEAGQGSIRARPWMRFCALVEAYVEGLKKSGQL